MKTDNNNNTYNGLKIWALTSGQAGMRSQVLGVAHAIGGDITEKVAQLNSPWHLLPGHLVPSPLNHLKEESSPFTPPWPDILISSGRRSTSISIAIGKLSQGKTYRVHIQNPQIATKHFDLVASMAHDEVTGENVITTNTALHNIRAQNLEEAKQQWQNKLIKDHQSPVLGVILGGKNKQFGFDQECLEGLINLIKKARDTQNARILITPSRRTEAFVKQALYEMAANDETLWMWDESGENPYLAILALSDHICVTADSVSMISEGLYTGKPVHIYPLNGTSRRHGLFLSNLVTHNLINQITGEIDFSVQPSNQTIDETSRIAEIIREKITQRA